MLANLLKRFDTACLSFAEAEGRSVSGIELEGPLRIAVAKDSSFICSVFAKDIISGIVSIVSIVSANPSFIRLLTDDLDIPRAALISREVLPSVAKPETF